LQKKKKKTLKKKKVGLVKTPQLINMKHNEYHPKCIKSWKDGWSNGLKYIHWDCLSKDTKSLPSPPPYITKINNTKYRFRV
jgi:hypothetical protein